MNDRQILYTTALLRSISIGMTGVLLGLYLARLNFAPAIMGVVITSGLMGAAAAALVVTLAGDRIGRKRTLLWLAALSTLGGIVAALGSDQTMIMAAAFIGMLNGMGRDRGAALVLEQAILPATTDDAARTKTFAWYNVLTDIGHAVGGLFAAVPTALHYWGGLDELTALRSVMMLYPIFLAITGLLYLKLSTKAETPSDTKKIVISPQSRKVLWRIALLFGLDSLAGGFLGTALLAYFFHAKFGAGEALIGGLFFAARIANAFSHLGAAWLAKRIGLVNTMVFTHIPSSFLLVTVAFAPNFWVAALLFLLREGLVEMDVPTRQSYVMAVVKPEERTFASGVTNLVRLGGWAAAPAFAGWLMSALALSTPLVIGAGMKIAYDVMLYFSFRGIKPPEEK
jgi:MFS family permease